MKDINRTKKELLDELKELHQRVSELEESESEREGAEKEILNNRNQLDSIFRVAPVGIGVVIDRKFQFVNDRFCKMLGYAEKELVGQLSRIIYPSDDEFERVGKYKYEEIQEKGTGTIETILRKKDGSLIDVLMSSTPLNPQDLSEGVTFTALDITERVQAENALRASEKSLREAQKIGTMGSWERYFETGEVKLSEEFFRILGVESTSDMHFDDVMNYVHPEDKKELELSIKKTLESKVDQWQNEYRIIRPNAEVRYIVDRATIVLDNKNEPIVGKGIIQDITERKQIENEIQQYIQQLNTLREIDQAIMGNKDLKSILDIILETLLAEINIDAALVFCYEKTSQNLIFSHGKGFQTKALQYTNLQLGYGLAGKTAQQKSPLFISNLNLSEASIARSPEFKEEEFISYYGIPLIAKGDLVGVLEVFHRSALNPEEGWGDYLHILAGQAAIAIDNITLFRDLQRSNQDLLLAYDATIEGWGQALELRDMETEGHSRRVVDLTVSMAAEIGFDDKEITDAYRGALLHDIGKMGIPDAILQKPGKLTKKEREIIQLHPVYAYEWLSSIDYLKSALDIPYCHHERWDGTGYPRGLKREEIPLVARIFAIADVWDALCSDRPYRKAWSKEKALEHIRSESGKHLDPDLVKVFIKLVSS